MGTAISRTVTWGVAALGLAVSGCGAKSSRRSAEGSSSTTVSSQTQISPLDGADNTLGWLHPTRSPTGWRVVRIANGATMPYPPGWRRTAGDVGTATAVLRSADHQFLGYLNLTPQQGDESLSNWGSFRLGHDAREGDRGVKALAGATNLRFRTGLGSCIRDAYTTAAEVRYIELACLVAGPKVTSVIVGAAPPQIWGRMSSLIERAISAFTT